MRHGDVVALVVDVANRLPVHRRGLRPDPVGRHHVRELVVGKLRCDRRHQFGDRGLRPLAETDEDHPVPDFQFERREAELGLVEIGKGARPRRAAQRAVQIVYPAVEGADQRVLAVALVVRDDAAAAMPADVVEGAHLAVLAADHERTLADNVHRQVVARLRHVRHMTDDLPVIAEDMLLLELEQRLAVIGPTGQTTPVPIVRNGHVEKMVVHMPAL